MHTTSLHLQAGDTYTFPDRSLLLEPVADNRLWELTVEIVLIPAVQERSSTWKGLSADEKAVRQLTARAPAPSRIVLPALAGDAGLRGGASNISSGWRLVGSRQELERTIQGMQVTARDPPGAGGGGGGDGGGGAAAAAPPGATRPVFSVLRFWFRMYQSGARATLGTRNALHIDTDKGACRSPWINWPLCDIVAYATDIRQAIFALCTSNDGS